MKLLKPIFLPLLILAAAAANAQDTEIVIHKATKNSIQAHISKIDHELLNKKLNFYPVFTHNYNPGGGSGIYQPNQIGMYFFNDQWRLYDEGLNAFIENSEYNILIPGVGTSSWVHTATKDNISNNYTLIDHPKFNGNPNVQLFVSHMFNPGGEGNNYHNHQVGVFYSIVEKKWGIYNEGLDAMSPGAAFNVVFVNASSDLTRFTHIAKGENTSGHITVLDNDKLNNNPNAKIIIAHMYNPSGALSSKYNDHPIGVYYNGSKWAIYNEDKEDLALETGFFVLIVNDEQTASNNNITMEIPSLRIGPNPITQGNNLTISMYNEQNSPLELEVLDITGKVLLSKSLNSDNVIVEQLSTETLTSGVYVLRIRGERLYATRRLIIQ